MRGRRAVFVAAALLASGVPVVGAGGPAGASASLCSAFSAAKVSAALGVKATKVTPDKQGFVTVCWYQVRHSPRAVFVRVQTHDSLSGYRLDLKNATTYAEHPKSDASFAPYPAFWTAIGSTAYGYTYTVTVLKKSVEVSVGSTGTTLAKVEGLAKRVLASV